MIPCTFDIPCLISQIYIISSDNLCVMVAIILFLYIFTLWGSPTPSQILRQVYYEEGIIVCYFDAVESVGSGARLFWCYRPWRYSVFEDFSLWHFDVSHRSIRRGDCRLVDRAGV